MDRGLLSAFLIASVKEVDKDAGLIIIYNIVSK